MCEGSTTTLQSLQIEILYPEYFVLLPIKSECLLKSYLHLPFSACSVNFPQKYNFPPYLDIAMTFEVLFFVLTSHFWHFDGDRKIERSRDAELMIYLKMFNNDFNWFQWIYFNYFNELHKNIAFKYVVCSTIFVQQILFSPKNVFLIFQHFIDRNKNKQKPHVN